MNSALRLALIGVCYLFSPKIGFAGIDYSANKIIGQVQSGKINEVYNAFSEVETALQKAETPFSESKKFLQSLIDEVNVQYGMSLTMRDACRLIRENIHSIHIPHELQPPLLSIIQLIEFEDISAFPPSEKLFFLQANTNVFGYGLYWPWEWNWFGLNKKPHKSHKSEPSMLCYHHNVELELPPKMAAGFACALGGALCCIIPGGQGIGLMLIGTGLGLTLDGLANGERPYYVESKPN